MIDNLRKIADLITFGKGKKKKKQWVVVFLGGPGKEYSQRVTT